MRFWSARRSYSAQRENSSERKKSDSLGFSFLRYVYSLRTLLFSYIGGVGCKYIDNARGHVLVVIRGNPVRARPGEDSCAVATQRRRLVRLGARHVL